MSEGFGDIEMEEENEEEEETSFGGDDLEDNPEDHNRSINIINTENSAYAGNPKSKCNRVDLSIETPVNISRKMRNLKSIITNDRKLSFKKIFKIRLEKKNGPNNSILLDNTTFVRDQKGNSKAGTSNVSIIFKGEKNW